MLIAVAMFSLMDMAMKLLSAHYPAMQVTALRALSSLPLVLIYLGWRGAFASILKVRWSLHLLRGILGITMITTFTYGLQRLSLAEAYSIFFIAPMLITALSVFILKEKVDRARWCAIVVGLGGVLLVLRPNGREFFSVGGLAVLAAAACYAVSNIVARVLSRSDSSESMVFWLIIMMAIGGGILCAHEWMAIRAEDWLLLSGLSLSGFLGLLAITEAFRTGKASSVAPFEYSALAWGMGLDWILWQVLPTSYTLLGAAVIVASGVYLIRRESMPVKSEHL
ncbi:MULTISPECIES: DMT family transporter [unclassified Undibacterium]|uniref:DMT family transporter n=1 Tax=unclassified Undibacterium TaxID=2630295 RepID=UPI002AC92385|nr:MULTISPECIES: DMT family transporter [unclassified Undibacterium]MEB0140485.1 DMT family transporter [Undibacterium sp. CCC2.1]MEB0173728.1 DMT family transporter [Undibacterium sp. CCC1.1]MEB0177728.1 DMT family transporter [Undibacterium sp. CCC3.4]MEB0217025.1 DMT family transporter [Undibacterium sp. 5I2]WPX45596.1 DMT family transporter [Undibacterium sp. CCC3.4]